MASPNLSAAVTATFEDIAPDLHDNVMNNNALLAELNKAGRIEKVSGGRFLRHNLTYAENGTYTRYQGSQTVNISQNEILSAAQYPLRYVSVAVSMDGQEEAENGGEAELVSLVETKVENAKTTFMNNMSIDIYSDGTASGGLQVGGLQSIIAKSPATGTVGGINAANYAFWRNGAYDGSGDLGADNDATNIQGHMTTVYTSRIRNGDRPNLIVADTNLWTFYHNSLIADVRHVNKERNQAGTGFPELDFMGVPVVLDGGLGGACPTDTMYFINTKHLKLKVHKDRSFKPIGGERRSVNQDAYVILNLWAGNLCCGNRELQAVLHDA